MLFENARIGNEMRIIISGLENHPEEYQKGYMLQLLRIKPMPIDKVIASAPEIHIHCSAMIPYIDRIKIPNEGMNSAEFEQGAKAMKDAIIKRLGSLIKRAKI